MEQHADYKKNDGIRAVKNGVGRNDILVHRLYGAARIDNGIYRTKTTVYEYMNDKNIPHDYQITKVELLISGSSASNALSNPTHVSATKILQGIEKSYDKGKKTFEREPCAPTLIVQFQPTLTKIIHFCIIHSCIIFQQ